MWVTLASRRSAEEATRRRGVRHAAAWRIGSEPARLLRSPACAPPLGSRVAAPLIALEKRVGETGGLQTQNSECCGRSPLFEMDATLMDDLDRQIASVMDCNPLLEDEVVRLCEKVEPTRAYPSLSRRPSTPRSLRKSRHHSFLLACVLCP